MRPSSLALTVLLVLAACRNDPDKPDTNTSLDDTAVEPVDEDGDGWDTRHDCDDQDATVYPGAEEICDGLDQDCNGEIDEDATDATSWYADADGDGYGDPGDATQACEAPDGYVSDATDCDDADAEVHPGAPERCDDIDNDCDGDIDEDLQEIWYADADGDGFGNADSTLESCDPGEGWVADATDCDDANSTVNPGAEEVCNDVDDDCDEAVDEDLEATWYQDADGDGYGDPEVETFDCDLGAGWVYNAADCDDANSAIHPDAQEECNGYDDDCDGLVDDEDDSVTGLETWYLDADADGYGDDASTTTACDLPSGYAEYGGDCDDGDAAYNPGATEDDCTDPADYNCDGSTGYTDDDGDGYAACEDCDDTDDAVNPDADEVCNNVDDDCDGTIDEDDATDAGSWYADTDGDGYGDAASTTAACDQPSGYVSLAYATDCDDSDASVSPVAAESCNGVDDDCDGTVDEGVTDTFYLDSDGDGYGDAGSTTEDCALPSGYSADDTDCDDTNPAINPAASELCDGVDNDCDGTTDETDALDASTWYRDNDGDGYGDSAASTVSCDQPTGYVSDATDCEDGDDDVFPGAEEACDGIDNDCDGSVDEDLDSDGDGLADCDDTEECDGVDNDGDGLVDDDDPDVTGTSTWYVDYDGDGYGGALLSTDACDQPSNYVADSTDCDDADASAYPGAGEICDGADNDCDGTVDEDDASDASSWYADADEDGYGDASTTDTACSAPSGYVSDATDCDDADAALNPSAEEICDGLDNDCDGLTDEDDPDLGDASTWYADADGDGYGDQTSSTEACSQPTGTVADDGDCDDVEATTNPGASEICDGIDNDCDGTVDEDDATDAGTWYADTDGDGYGDLSNTTAACDQPSDHVTNTTDCDDDNNTVYPGASEICDGLDNDCDGTVDDGATISWYADADADGYGDGGAATDACTAPSGHVADATDCDDGDAAINPAASELCNGVDDDCDGTVDEDDATDASTWYIDADADGYGSATYTAAACSQPSGYVADATDCDDYDGDVNPGGTETCNGVDDDCDGTVDEDDATDVSTWYADADSDGYGDAATTAEACDAPSGYTDDDTDCDDGDSSVHPGASEACDGLDNDCDGDVDEGACLDISNVSTSTLELGESALTVSSDTTIDTDTGEIDGLRASGTGLVDGIYFQVVVQASGPDLGVFSVTGLTVDSGTTLWVQGDNALVVASAGDGDVSGTIDLTGEDGTDMYGTSGPNAGGEAVAGGDDGGDGSNNVYNGATDGAGDGGGFIGQAGIHYGNGGGGAGYCWGGGGGMGGSTSSASDGSSTAGGDGAGSSSEYGYYGGDGGGPYGTYRLEPLLAGSGGGGGLSDTDTNPNGGAGGGGAGGGALQLSVDGTLSVSGNIEASGGRGGDAYGGGGGGGSGGAVLLEALDLDVGGALYAEGGRGGHGNLSWVSSGTTGGDAGSGSAPGGGAASRESGGGGGATGWILLRYLTSTSTTSATISPDSAGGCATVEAM